MASFEVKVVNADKKPVHGAQVKLEFTDKRQGMSSQEYTDSDGVALFYGHDQGDIRIYINGDNYGKYRYEDGEQVTITAK
jgi:hypothetical protein